MKGGSGQIINMCWMMVIFVELGMMMDVIVRTVWLGGLVW